MLKNNLGYPRIGSKRELKKACEQYWAGKISLEELALAGKRIREQNWRVQQEAGVDLIPCNDFSYYDHVLDMSLTLGNIPDRYHEVVAGRPGKGETDLYFAMARGYQQDGLDITAMEMTKWFDTNYHYIVPEFSKNQSFRLFSDKIIREFTEATQFLKKTPKPVVVGPVSYLLLGKEKESGFHKLDLLPALLPVYTELIRRLQEAGAEWVQLDEPFLSMDLSEQAQEAYRRAYAEINGRCRGARILLATYFEALGDHTELATGLPVDALHIDLVRAPRQLDEVLKTVPENLLLSLGVIDGRNIWKNDHQRSLDLVEKTVSAIGRERVMIAPSCSLLHVPFDLELETDLDPGIRNWMAFAKQKLGELDELSEILDGSPGTPVLETNRQAIESRRHSPLIHQEKIKQRTGVLTEADTRRRSDFAVRQQIQRERFKLPLFPSTTIGSFPQTGGIRRLRSGLRKGELTPGEYDTGVKKAIADAIRLQEELELDVLVHGEFERNDMVEYFGELMGGFVFTKNGWVQSYGSRCVKPPVIFGDVDRRQDMTVSWSRFAQSLTSKPVKGMLTGPVTMLQWSFVRDDQPRSETALQIALAIREEVRALEKAGIGIIQIDEPAMREGLPLRKKDWDTYLDWAIRAFRIASGGAKDETQIHTHMCYSEFNDIIEHIARMDADVITIETSRSQMELLDAFADFNYPGEIGPGVYDIHSPRIPSVEEMQELLEKAAALLPPGNIWVNPDCGLKTRKWPETEAALRNMVQAARQSRQFIKTKR